VANFVGRATRSFRESRQLKIASYHQFTKKRVHKDRPHFSQATRNWEHSWCPKHLFKMGPPTFS